MIKSVTTILKVFHKPELDKWVDRMTKTYFEQEMKKVENVENLSEKDSRDLVQKILVDASGKPNEVRDQMSGFGTQIHDLIDKVKFNINFIILLFLFLFFIYFNLIYILYFIIIILYYIFF